MLTLIMIVFGLMLSVVLGVVIFILWAEVHQMNLQNKLKSIEFKLKLTDNERDRKRLIKEAKAIYDELYK